MNTTPESRHRAWDVFLGRRWMTTVFYLANVEADEVRRGLINHDGYDAGIIVRERIGGPEVAPMPKLEPGKPVPYQGPPRFS